MKPCARLNDYCDLKLPPEARETFERHLPGCDSCSAVVDQWKEIGQIVRAIGIEAIEAQRVQTEVAKHRIVERLARDQARPASTVPALVWVAAATILVVGGFVMFYFMRDQDELPGDRSDSVAIDAVRFVASSAEPQVATISLGSQIRVGREERVLLRAGRDRVGLAQNSVAEVIEARADLTRLRLESGTLACAVEPRRGEHAFIVEIHAFEVRVIGTRFSITVEGEKELDVVVDRGEVEVTDAERHVIRVTAGQRLFVSQDLEHGLRNAIPEEKSRIDRLLNASSTDSAPLASEARKEDVPREDSAEPLPSRADDDEGAPERATERSAHRTTETADSLATWQQWVLNDRIDDAERALSGFVSHNPTNADAWFLLADCKKRKRDFEGAVAAYRQAAERLPGRAADTARYRAGVILQQRLGRHGEAIEAFEQFLERAGSGHHLRAEAMLRLASSLEAVGQTERANNLLEEIVNRHGATGAALKAQRLLNEKKSH